MKMKVQRRLERDRARRDDHERIHEAERRLKRSDDDHDPASEDERDLEVARRLRSDDV